jgi:energy-coupling factor transporter ATP-binding protein EcfA2
MSQQSQTGDQPYNENQAMSELLDWSVKLPAWQRDAMRRIIENGSLSVEDKEELKAICINPDAPYIPFSEEQLTSTTVLNLPVSLVSISDPKHINALASDQNLQFHRDGLTVVYGDNGSGKSGYVRILKNACRSRDQNFKILRDVADTSDEVQSAALKFMLGSDEKLYDWSPDKNEHNSLPAVSIFDSKSANTHVEKTNDLAYTPFPLLLLGELSETCTEVNSFIDHKIRNVQAQTPQSLSVSSLNAETDAGDFINTLSKDSSIQILDSLTDFTNEDEKELKCIELDLAQDSKKASQKIQNQKDRLEKCIHKLKKIIQQTSETSFQNIKKLQSGFEKKAILSKTASEELFESSPLPNISSDSWKILWEAARKYSNEEAYPSGEFPNTNPDKDLCVLCQQPLTAEASNRASKFEDFVKSTLKSDENSAEKALKDAKDAAAQVALPEEFSETLFALVNTELDNSTLAEELKSNAEACISRLEALIKGNAPSTEAKTLPIASITKICDDMGKRIKQLNADENSPEKLKLIAKRNDLQDRKSLKPLKNDVIAEIERLKLIADLTAIKKKNSKKILTTKNKEISDQLVTDALRGRFAREVTKLDIGTMPLELVKSDRNATSLFKVCFVEKPNEPVGEVLSEGEHRCVALASFLAELVTAKEYSGIVFDDPMSSLDHKYRERVSKRLVEESEHRQVVVFTHDLAFLFELKRAAEEQKLAINFQHVKKKAGIPGHIENELPMKARSALSISNEIRSELKSLKGQFDNSEEIKRTITAKGVIAELRAAWEQGIADFIMPVLGRFENSVKGNSLFKLAILTDEDVAIVKSARGRLSENLHHSSETLNPVEVSHSDLVEEVKILEAWLSDIQTRQKAA